MLRSRRRRNRIVFAIALAAVLILPELGARLYIVTSAPDVPTFWASDLPDNLRSEFRRISTHLNDDGVWDFEDFHDGYYTIVDDQRRTVGQPAQYSRTLWLFGNSGMFDPITPDALTTASQLQKLLNQSGYRVRVVNAALPAMTIRQELVRLKTTAVSRGDIVVFVDGIMDVTLGGCNERLALLQVICLKMSLVPHFDRRDIYLSTTAQARDYARSIGAEFYHFLQPCSIWQAVTPFGMPILVPPGDFIGPGSCHMLAHGDAIAAHALYDALTLI